MAAESPRVKVYLAGPINGCTDGEASGWRTVVKERLGADRCIDPMRRDYRGREDESFRQIVESDLADIAEATAVIVNPWKPSVGTSMECWHAFLDGTPIVVVAHQDAPLSPWWRYVASAVVCDPLEAADAALLFLTIGYPER